MSQTILTSINPSELVRLINEGIREQLQEFTSRINSKPINDEKPHLTRQETANFFDVSPNCINDWSNKGILKRIKVGQRVYFSKEECLQLMFNQTKTA